MGMVEIAVERKTTINTAKLASVCHRLGPKMVYVTMTTTTAVVDGIRAIAVVTPATRTSSSIAKTANVWIQTRPPTHRKRRCAAVFVPIQTGLVMVFVTLATTTVAVNTTKATVAVSQGILISSSTVRRNVSVSVRPTRRRNHEGF